MSVCFILSSLTIIFINRLLSTVTTGLRSIFLSEDCCITLCSLCSFSFRVATISEVAIPNDSEARPSMIVKLLSGLESFVEPVLKDGVVLKVFSD